MSYLNKETDNLIKMFIRYVETHKDFKALEKLPTLYHDVEVYLVPMFDTVDIVVKTRTFEPVDNNKNLFQGHLWNICVSHHSWDTIEDTKKKLDVELDILKETVLANAYPLPWKYVKWFRKGRKQGIHVAQWRLP